MAQGPHPACHFSAGIHPCVASLRSRQRDPYRASGPGLQRCPTCSELFTCRFRAFAQLVTMVRVRVLASPLKEGKAEAPRAGQSLPKVTQLGQDRTKAALRVPGFLPLPPPTRGRRGRSHPFVRPQPRGGRNEKGRAGCGVTLYQGLPRKRSSIIVPRTPLLPFLLIWKAVESGFFASMLLTAVWLQGRE